MSKAGPKILLVVGGGIAAYKSCELVRLIRKGGGEVTCVVTKAGQQFVTPMSLAALSEKQVYTSLFDLKDEVEMGHIQLSREADLIVVCPATADLMAKMAEGIADDLATTLILATDKPVMAVPAMNVRMWEHEATQRNVEQLKEAGVTVLHPDEGPMACGEFGYGRLPEPEAIWAEIAAHFGIEIERPEPVAVPTPAANDEQPAEVEAVEDESVEVHEPEEEEESKSGGLGGLLSMIIPRSTEKRSHEEIEAELCEAEEAAEGALEEGCEAEVDEEGEAPEDQEAPGEEEEIEFNPELEGSPLAAKGKASAAPPIDPEASNHEVDERKAAPETVAKAASDDSGVEVVEEDALGGNAFGVSKDYQPLLGRHILITAGPTWEAIAKPCFPLERLAM